MDGTLLNSNHEVSDQNKKILKRVVDAGVMVVISTGRLFASAKVYAKYLDLITPIIACNGAYICEYHRSNVIYENPLNKDDYIKVANLLEKHDMYYHFYDNENFYTVDLNYNSLKYHNWNQKQKPEDRINIEVIEDGPSFLNNSNPKIYKMVVMDNDDEKLNFIASELRKNENIEVISSLKNSFDIMNKGVTKGSALARLCEKYGINKDEVIAIGDNHNDISMLEFAGTKVAMGNSEKEVLDIANIITDTNDNHGVGKALENLILKN